MAMLCIAILFDYLGCLSKISLDRQFKSEAQHPDQLRIGA
jgi:hypothetical protein